MRQLSQGVSLRSIRFSALPEERSYFGSFSFTKRAADSLVVGHFGGARLLTSRLARKLAPPNWQSGPLPIFFFIQFNEWLEFHRRNRLDAESGRNGSGWATSANAVRDAGDAAGTNAGNVQLAQVCYAI